MAEREGLLHRWSRLKAEGGAPPAPAPDSAPDTGPDTEPAVDPAELPPIDSLGADSDYRVFLKTGVPAALRLAALRRAWASDPKIAGFRGFGEYDWDCNAPGYGQLLPTDDIRRLCDAVLGERQPEAADGETEAEPEAVPSGQHKPVIPTEAGIHAGTGTLPECSGIDSAPGMDPRFHRGQQG